MISADLQTILHALFLSLVTGTPLLLAGFCCTSYKQTVTRFLPWAAVPALLTALSAPVDVVVEVPWFFMGGRMGLDETGRIFLCLASFIWFLASFSSRSMLTTNRNQNNFLVFFLTAMAGNFGLILARGMLGFYLFFAVMSFAAYGLVVNKGTNEAAKAGRIYLTLVMIGEVALCTALIILVHNTGSLAIGDIAGITDQSLPLTLLFIGFGVKIGAVPLHGWMMPTYQAAPIPAAAVLAGAMVNAGILGWLRFLPLGRTFSLQGAMLFIAAGAFAAVYGVIIGLKQKKAGAVLGCSSISQMGLITVIFGLGLLDHEAGLHAAPVLIMYIVHHSLAKSCLFFGYDLVVRQGKRMSRLQMAAILLPALSLAGLPFTSGAITKTALKELAVTIGAPWYSLNDFFLPITALGTTLLMFHFICVLNSTGGIGNSERSESKIIFSISFTASLITFWLWPAGIKAISHSLTGVQLLKTLWPVAGGGLLFLVWSRIFSFTAVLSSDKKNQTLYDSALYAVTRFMQEKERETPQQSRFKPYLDRIIPQLRKYEKVLGRWKVAGLSYIALCLGLLYLLL